MESRCALNLMLLAMLLALALSLNAQTLQVLHTFEANDGFKPGALMMDQAGNVYGATVAGGTYNCSSPGRVGCGTLFEVSPNISGWTFTTLYKFQSNADGCCIPSGIHS